MEERMRKIIQTEEWSLPRLITCILTEISQEDFDLLDKNWEGVIGACEELHNAARGSFSKDSDDRIERAKELCTALGVSEESQNAIIECAKMTISGKEGE